jgi:hypothetical protein
LSQPWIGPYEIISVDEVNIIVILPRKKILKVHANRLKPFLVELQEMDHKLWFAFMFFVICSIAIALDVNMQQFKEVQDRIMTILERCS